jgi:hypothetical protein
MSRQPQRVRLKEDILGPAPNFLTIPLTAEDQAKIDAAIKQGIDKTEAE